MPPVIRYTALSLFTVVALSLATTSAAEPAEEVVKLAAQLKDPNEAVRLNAVKELEKLKEKARPVSSAIVEATMDSATGVREAAAGCLEKVDPKIYKQVVAVLYDINSKAKHEAIRELAALGADATDFVKRKEWADSTRSRVLATIGTAFKFGVEKKLLPVNPLAYLKRPSIRSRAADVVLTKEQHERLKSASPEPFRLFLEFLWLTGCRPSEAGSIEARHCDLKTGTVTLTKHKTSKKTGKNRIIPLREEAVELLAPLVTLYPTGHLLRNRIGQPWKKVTWGAAMRTARAKAKLPKSITYGMRHSFATELLASGISDTLVAATLGHANTNMVHKNYSHVSENARLLVETVRKVKV